MLQIVPSLKYKSFQEYFHIWRPIYTVKDKTIINMCKILYGQIFSFFFFYTLTILIKSVSKDIVWKIYFKLWQTGQGRVIVNNINSQYYSF